MTKQEEQQSRQSEKTCKDCVEIEIDGRKMRIQKKEWDMQERFLEERRWKKR